MPPRKLDSPSTIKGTGRSASPAKRPTERPLTVRQERFCERIAAGDSGTDAYLAGGWNGSRKTARVNAAKLLAKTNIKARIAELRAPQTRKALLSKDRKRELLKEFAERADAGLLTRIRAIEVDAKLAGHFEPDRTEIDVGPKTLLSIKERAEQVESALAGKYQTS